MAKRGRRPSSNGSTIGGLSRARLQRLYDFHFERAKAIMLVLGMVSADIGERKADKFSAGDDDSGPGAMVAQAIKIRKQAKHAKPAPNGLPPNGAENIRRRRQLTAEFLQTFSATEPRLIDRSAPASGGSGVLIKLGYLKRAKNGEGYIRTGKEFTP